jgi:hypothetical protein
MLRNAKLILLAGAFVGAAGLMMAADIPNNFLELDGNSVVDSIDDWNLLNGTGACTTPGVPTGCGGAAGSSLAHTFASGSASVAVFAGGGSKDPLDIPNWKWKTGGTPDKDAITNGYAAAYKAPSGHLILEFGADRFAVNGDANIGFWFFQQDVHPTGSGSGGGSPFSGAHSDGDIFVVSAFTQGGGVSTITVYSWDHSCAKGVQNPGIGQCAESNLKLRFKSDPNAANCVGQQEGCAIVNPAGINVSWPYLAKFGSNVTTIPQGGFYEGGVDVNALLGEGNLECFTSFLIETRTAQTASSVLKDFVSGSFNICGLSATKTCAGNGVVNSGGNSIHYLFNGTAVNTGIGGLSDVTVVDALPSGSNVVFKKGSSPATPLPTTVTTTSCPTGSPAGAVCANLGSVAAGATEYWSVEFDSTGLNVQNDAYVAGLAGSGTLGVCGTGGTVCSSHAQDSCSTAPTNSITISKSCAVPTGYPNATLPGTQLITQSGLAAVQVNFSGDINNTGQTSLSGITLTDNPSATITVAWPDPTKPGVIPAGESAKYSGSYLPTGVTAGDLGGAAGRYSFADEIKVTGATALLGDSPGHDATCTSTFGSNAQACGGATCNICPAGASCSGQ